MLKLKNITKDYQAGDTTVRALKGIDLEFRESEFVSILGQSGCGKTTLLNLIGGLDQYTSGDLVINGKSTKDFRDGDWDTYRNHSVGFVFQTYNLIPHQTVLSNVELALTLSGVSKAERRRRATEALEKVGLADQIHKKPNQMSGGQMQRVAIARALVNNPDILLADEPTGALDSETSVQIMEILKEISKDKLIIMVTHNPELAEQYSSRIIRLLDGQIIGDTNPYVTDVDEVPSNAKIKKPAMSFFTALGLSLNNLMTKKARTILTAFAGAIGIIGIALILSLSNGIQTYINKVQEDTLSSYPITLEAETLDMSALVTSMMGTPYEIDGENAQPHELDAVYSNTILYDLLNNLMSMETSTNNLKAFKEYLQNNEEIKQYISSVQYSYDLDMNIYAKDADGKIFKSDITTLMQEAMSSMYGGDYSSFFASSYGDAYSQMEVWEEMLPPQDATTDENGNPVLINELLTSQYDVIYGAWPTSYDEVVLIVNDKNEISDLVIYGLGLGSSEEVVSTLATMVENEESGKDGDEIIDECWSYEEICEKTFKIVLPAEYYQYDSVTGRYNDISTTDAGIDFLYNSEDIGTTVKISGIVRPNEDAVSSMLSGAIGYTSALTEYLLEKTAELDIIEKQKDDPETDVILGLPFLTDDYYISDEQKIDDIKAYAAELSAADKADMYVSLMSVPAPEYVDAIVEQQMGQLTREYIEEMVTQTYAEQMGVDAETVMGYIAQMDDETLFGYVEDSMREQIAAEYAAGVEAQMSQMTAEQLAGAMDMLLEGNETMLQYAGMAPLTAEQFVWLYDEFMPATVSEGTYEDNLKLLGDVNLASPKTINIYATTFADKDAISNAIDSYNASVSEDDEITYTDYVALLMSSITTIIDAISYVLIAFVAISLVVSSIMIGIITYISVLERTKEIGILRAIGASKRDISRVFNAETLIEGFVSGVLGIGVTLLLIIPINAIVQHLTDISSLRAILPAPAAVILVIISMVLTFIAGLIPSGLAAKKDPVVALRTE
ncbi:MAG: ABC transporter ATP-binding protein/permease [Oscillospiraceae bacterium]|nr:ABC transporter ATP-binding protein/permease [Oscillospiraceae bacterium]